MKHKVSELEGALLDAAVAKAMGYNSIRLVPEGLCGTWYAGESDGGVNDWFPSKSWEQSGPIIERESIGLGRIYAPDLYNEWGDRPAFPITWAAKCGASAVAMEGPTPLVAAMRAFVHSKFGDFVEI